MANESIGLGGIAWRIAAALLLVLATFNPTGHSFVHWLAQDFPHVTAAKGVTGVALLICWVVYATTTLRALGRLGLLLLLALFAALVWFAVDRGWLSLRGDHALAWIVLVITGLILGVGMCWSAVRAALSGQATVEEIEHH